MGLQHYAGLAICLLVVTASVATTTAQSPKDSPCTLPKPDQAEALGTLTEILSAPLNGTVGAWTGQVGASGQVCLAVYESNGDYNIFYSVLASSPTAGEPTFAGIAKDVGQERIVAVFFSPPGTDGPWVDLTTTSSLPQSRKSLGDASASPTTYTYALNGTWLQASTLTTFQGDTYKQLVDSIVAGPEGYCTGFGTTAVMGGAAMGQFQIQPVAVKA
ncbi:unnamed protein product [Closterium sp. Yama58-4]|nr:unnamed protein product [Closterium sp. Yama58-4]